MKKLISLLLAFSMFASVCSTLAFAQARESAPTPLAVGSNTTCNIVPRPVEYSPLAAEFTLQPGTRFVISGSADEAVLAATQTSCEAVAADFRKSTGYGLPVVIGQAADGDIVIHITSAAGLPAEGYQLVVNADRVEINAPDAAGAYYALQTLRQRFPGQIENGGLVENVAWTAAGTTVRDYPRYPYRGIQLDVARHFFRVDEIKRQIDHMSHYKINKLHLHLADDQGWRIEIKNNPDVQDKDGNPVDFSNLTRLGASTSTSINGYNPGYYTQDEFRDIVAYAAARNVEIVPEIDMPGHCWAALVSMPMLNSTPDGKPIADGYDNTKPYEGTDVGWCTMECRNENTYIFIDEVFRQLSELCPGTYLHIGGDEAHVTDHDDYIYFVNRVTDIAKKYGKTPIGWQDYDKAVSDLENTLTQYWNSSNERLTPGVNYIVSPSDRIYLDIKHDENDPVGLEWAGHNPVNDAYCWDPEDMGTADQIHGVEAPLWTETIATASQMDYMLYPRLPGVAEIGWTAKTPARDWTEYSARLATHGDRLDSLGIRYRKDTMIWRNTADFYMPMDENTGSTISSRDNKFTATFDNNVTWTEGKYGAGLHLNGQGCIDLGIADVEGDWTAGLWIKREPVPGNNVVLMSGKDGEIKLEQYPSTHKVGITKLMHYDAAFNYSVPENEWVHLAIVSDRGTTKLYANGEPVDSMDRTIAAPLTWLGGNGTKIIIDHGYMKGDVDELFFVSHAMTTDEIQRMMLSGNPYPDNMVYHFNEGKDAATTDAAGKNTLTLGAGVTWAEGSEGTGLKFDGTGSVDLPGPDLGPNWTIGVWVNRNESVFDNAVLLEGDEGELKLEQYENTNKVGVTRYPVNHANAKDAASGYELPIGQWTHLTFVGTPLGTSLYVNGVLSETMPVGISGPAKRLGAGDAKHGTNAGNMAATIDDLQLYSRAMTASEVAALPRFGDIALLAQPMADLQEALTHAEQYSPDRVAEAQAMLAAAQQLIDRRAVTINEVNNMAAELQQVKENLTVGFRWNGASLSVAGNIAVNFFASIPEAELPITQIELTVAGEKPVLLPASEAKQTDDGYQFTASVSVRQMTDDIQLNVLQNGRRLDQTIHFSVRQYADEILKDTAGTYSETLKTFVRTMLYHGANMQHYKNYRVEDLATAGLDMHQESTAAQKVQANTLPGAARSGNVSGLSLYGVSLSLEDETSLNCYFKKEADFPHHTYSLNADDYPCTVAETDEYVILSIKDIPASKLDISFPMQVSDGQNTLTVTYSPLTYARTIIENEQKNPALGQVGRSLVTYNAAAKALVNE